MSRSEDAKIVYKVKEWFDINHYKGVGQLDLNDWYINLSRRYWMREMLKHVDVNKISCDNKSNTSILKQKNTFLRYAELIEKQPIEMIDSLKDDFVFEREVVRGFSVLDMQNWINDDWFDTAYEYMNETPDALEDDQAYDFVAKPVNQHLMESFPDEIQEYAYLSIDLNTPDIVIYEKFKSWLKNNRREEAKKLKLKQIDKYTLKSWCNKQILPFIDINLINEIRNLRLTAENCTELSRADDYKTTKKYADFLLSLPGLYAIRNQLHQWE